MKKQINNFNINVHKSSFKFKTLTNHSRNNWFNWFDWLNADRV